MGVVSLTKEQFKKRWESDGYGGGITFDQIAQCAIDWGISRCPRTSPINVIRYKVLNAANTNDCEEFNPEYKGG